MYLLASNAGIKTGKSLAKYLGYNFAESSNDIPNGNIVAVRYGNAQRLNYGVTDLEINSRNSILRMSSKHNLKRYLEETGVMTPEYYTLESLPKSVEFPVLTRNEKHRAGRDINVINSWEDLEGKEFDYIVPFYPTLREYRVHVFDGNVVKIFRKYPSGRQSKGKSTLENPRIRTTNYGWEYVRSDLDQVLCSGSMVKTSLEVYSAIGCVFGAIDMAWSKQLERWIVWEINSAPSLNSSSLELYAGLITKLIARRSENDVRKPTEDNDRNLSYHN